jgi:ABC-type dipeptide/oligopeptide/nickel transport system permease subunit
MTAVAESSAAAPAVAQAPKANSPWRRLLRDKPAMLAALFLLLVFAAAIFAPLLAPTDPYVNNMRLRLKPPGGEFLLGTDSQGRSMVTRLLFGLRATLMIGLSAVAIGGFIGAALGILAAYYRRLDNVIMRVVDVLLSFPSILFGLALAAVLGPGLGSLVAALSVAAVPSVARIARGAATQVMQQEFMEAGKAIGLTDFALITRYLARNCISTIMVYLTLQLGQTILLGAALSFLGLGAQPPAAELGSMAAEGRRFLSFAPHAATVPSAAIFLIVLAFNVLGDALRDAFDPKLRH